MGIRTGTANTRREEDWHKEEGPVTHRALLNHSSLLLGDNHMALRLDTLRFTDEPSCGDRIMDDLAFEGIHRGMMIRFDGLFYRLNRLGRQDHEILAR